MTMSGKIAIVSGGGRDIGRAVALKLAKAGASVAINYHSSAEGAESAVGEIVKAGGRAFAMKGDMTDPKDVDAFVARTTQEFGRIDIVVPVTGGLVSRTKVADMSVEHFRHVIDLNVTSAFLLIKAALPYMTAGGAIVTLASQAGRDGGGPGAVAYAASKGAIMTMTRGMAKEFAPTIRVNSVCPGMIDTDFHNVFTKPEVRAHVANITPLKREGRPEEVADLVAYLASDQSSFLTGVCVDINGGTFFS